MSGSPFRRMSPLFIIDIYFSRKNVETFFSSPSTSFTRGGKKSFLFSLISVSILILLMRFFFLGNLGYFFPSYNYYYWSKFVVLWGKLFSFFSWLWAFWLSAFYTGVHVTRPLKVFQLGANFCAVCALNCVLADMKVSQERVIIIVLLPKAGRMETSSQCSN